MVGSPERSTAAHSSTAASLTVGGLFWAGTVVTTSASPQAVSAGRIRVDIAPGYDLAAAIASAVSEAMDFVSREVLTQSETGRAIPSISAVSGASNSIW